MQSLLLKDPRISEDHFDEEERNSLPRLRVEPYAPDRKDEWDEFVIEAKNATFLFHRDYMDYHGERFTDHSLMVYEGHKLVGVVPANLTSDGVLVSHQGLTYGGLAVPRTAVLKDVVACFYAIMRHLREEGISEWVYRRIPGFYNTLPDDDVSYALFLADARLFRRDCAMTISEADRLPLMRNRNALIKKAAGCGVRLVQEASLQPFWNSVLIPQLEARYGVKPVHTLEEITLLASRFPDHIRQFSAYCGDEIVSGATVYETPTVAHLQYAAVTEKGRQSGAQACLFNWLIEHYQHKDFFDFGTSNENEGRILNHGLLKWKEGFGARCYTHDFYEINTSNYTKLEPMLQGRREVFSPGPEWEQMPASTPSATSRKEMHRIS